MESKSIDAGRSYHSKTLLSKATSPFGSTSFSRKAGCQFAACRSTIDRAITHKACAMRKLIAVIAVFFATSVAHAQALNVQQPVVETTSIQTTVSVPDRGSVFLGGVGSAASGRQSYGPLRSGTSRGYSMSASSMRASVYIIDLQAMDEAILNSVPDSPVSLSIRRRDVLAELGTPQHDVVTLAEKAMKFERLAQQAEAAGKSGVARLHWQMAARHGSTLAQAKLNSSTADDARATAKN